ncbi:hypothetical protein COJ17_09540 [Bacillus thuringiensis]|uniref:restriction endonuclease n=1 Tax=Bacillus thuringiensis TaxID=1428 RepID=UPI000BF4941B|nr:restriction endonuclease [Bacillus thuringiensis]PEW48225.1 hypothetical protein CN444_11590 [Bacillus thuringiensis]PFK13275.1 hypothetical protein COJ17_09540 [Bacillus thuringiensis]
MTLPSYADIRLEFLKLTKYNEVSSVSNYVSKLAQVFNLGREQMELRTPCNAKRFYSRVNFTKKTLKEQGLITDNGSYVQLTPQGERLLKETPVPITNKILSMYRVNTTENVFRQDCNEVQHSKNKSEQLLNRLKAMDFYLFEDLMMDFLLEMGYGISKTSLKKNIKKTRDWGLDGHIELDVLGVDKIYIQAKRWGDTSVGIEYIQRFSGSIDTKGGNKGIFITTSTFTADARTCSELINNKFIRLIDGQELVNL